MADIHVAVNNNSKSISNEDLKRLLELMETVRYGSITIIIQDGKVVQIEKNEKVRLK